MKLTVNLRHLEEHGLHLQGELPQEDLDIQTHDEVIRLAGELAYDLQVEKLENGLLVTGRLELPLACQCVRCLKNFTLPLTIENYTLHVPLEGEDAVPIINDCADLTPFVREDILLEFPQHPLCDPGCGGLPTPGIGKAKNTNPGQTEAENGSSAWAELNKLKF